MFEEKSQITFKFISDLSLKNIEDLIDYFMLQLPIHQADFMAANQRSTLKANTRAAAKTSAMPAGHRHETFRRSAMEAQSVPNFLQVSQGFTQSGAGPSRLRTDDDFVDGANAIDHHPMLGVVETSPNHDDDNDEDNNGDCIELNVAGDKNYIV